VSNDPRKVLTSWVPRRSGTSGWYQLGDELWFRGDADPRDGWAGGEQISTLDPSSARSLALAARGGEARGRRLTVRNVTESVTTTLEIIGLGRLLLPRVADHRSGR
jgi:hypothetical protein